MPIAVCCLCVFISFVLGISNFQYSCCCSYFLSRSSLGDPPQSFCRGLLAAEPKLACAFGSAGGASAANDDHFNSLYGFRSMLFFPEDCDSSNSSRSLQVTGVLRN
jgi:hypothetical protein